MNIIQLQYFIDKYCYDIVRKNAYRSKSEFTTIENNTPSTQLATNGRYILSTELTKVESYNITRQNNATTNRDEKYVIWFTIFIYL